MSLWVRETEKEQEQGNAQREQRKLKKLRQKQRLKEKKAAAAKAVNEDGGGDKDNRGGEGEEDDPEDAEPAKSVGTPNSDVVSVDGSAKAIMCNQASSMPPPAVTSASQVPSTTTPEPTTAFAPSPFPVDMLPRPVRGGNTTRGGNKSDVEPAPLGRRGGRSRGIGNGVVEPTDSRTRRNSSDHSSAPRRPSPSPADVSSGRSNTSTLTGESMRGGGSNVISSAPGAFYASATNKRKNASAQASSSAKKDDMVRTDKGGPAATHEIRDVADGENRDINLGQQRKQRSGSEGKNGVGVSKSSPVLGKSTPVADTPSTLRGRDQGGNHDKLKGTEKEKEVENRNQVRSPVTVPRGSSSAAMNHGSKDIPSHSVHSTLNSSLNDPSGNSLRKRPPIPPKSDPCASEIFIQDNLKSVKESDSKERSSSSNDDGHVTPPLSSRTRPRVQGERCPQSDIPSGDKSESCDVEVALKNTASISSRKGTNPSSRPATEPTVTCGSNGSNAGHLNALVDDSSPSGTSGGRIPETSNLSPLQPNPLADHMPTDNHMPSSQSSEGSTPTVRQEERARELLLGGTPHAGESEYEWGDAEDSDLVGYLEQTGSILALAHKMGFNF